MKEYIEREMLLELYDNTDELNIDNFHVPIEVVRQNILDQPAADVKEVVHAEWLGKPLGGFATVRCSNCKNVFSENSGRWRYCPSCGAKMDLIK